MKILIFVSIFVLLVNAKQLADSIHYKYFCTGDCQSPAQVSTTPGWVLMGGGTDVDAAFIWMINKCAGGDFLVIRTTNDSLYDPYIYGLGNLNSAATLALFDREASFDPFVIKTIHNADCLFMAGGDQWTYYSFWKDTPVHRELIYLANMKGIPIGGTSAGMESMGQFVNTAEFSTYTDLTSQDALQNPYTELATLGENFLNLKYLYNVITDAHFFQRDRMGRLVAFVARIIQDVMAPTAMGIACDEATAVLVDSNGMASMVSWYNNGTAYFVIPTNPPTNCTPGVPLTFDNINVYKASGNTSNIFDLTQWTPLNTSNYQLSADNGVLTSTQKGGNIY